MIETSASVRRMPEISLTFLVALGMLDDDDREIVIDRVVTGVSLAAIAERLGVSRQTVVNRERVALVRLRSALERLGWER